MGKEKLYGFNDWISGTLEVSWWYSDPSFIIHKKGLKESISPDTIEAGDFMKIKQMQEYVYDKFVELLFNEMVKDFLDEYKNSPNPEAYRKREMENCEGMFQEHPQGIQDRVLRGVKDLSISANVCMDFQARVEKDDDPLAIDINEIAVLSAYMKYLKYLTEFNPEKHKGNNIIVSDKGFQSSLQPEQVTGLFKQLQDTFIDTSLDNWKAIFNNEPLPQGCSVKWKKSNRLLGYFIEELARLKIIDRDTNINKAIKNYFLDKKGNSFKDSIRQNRSGTGLNIKSKPIGFEAIDKILTILNSPLQ